MKRLSRIPQHIGIIPDGNRRWAADKGLKKQDGYESGLQPGLELYEMCLELGVKELTFYGFTVDNTKRPSLQIGAFQKACVDAVEYLATKDADLLVVGNTQSRFFPKALLPYTERTRFGRGRIKVNLLANYGWKWDLDYLVQNSAGHSSGNIIDGIASSGVSRIDLIIRWGGGRRLSGFLPIQSVYSDFYVVDELWPNYRSEQFYEALDWYQDQDVTLGG
ncbi:MAG TPA: undecaprenyl diphosphate synthase family protein [Demequina sp.]|nr:undecaprenyl diphosphate synthase family protein [Demequina sp.]